jgi:hypothetical protein
VTIATAIDDLGGIGTPDTMSSEVARTRSRMVIRFATIAYSGRAVATALIVT